MQQPSEGLHFGKYKLLERIATGGMAEIYRARMTAAAGVTKPVVIKKIRPGYAGNSAFLSMFVNEARIAAGLSHGNIAQVFDFGEVDGEYFIAMEWVDGRTLSSVMRRAREKGMYTLPQPLALLIAVEMLEGLAYAHTRLDERGRPLHIVHRDVSPQNVLLSYEGQVKLVDFGIARARLAGSAEPVEHGLKGKYTYFAPEQVRGREPDARSDIFAAGVVIYEMLCGRLPFEGKMPDVLRKLALGDFPRPRDLNPGIPTALERILLTALAVEREQRYATAEAFAEALTRHLHTAAPDVSSSARAHFMGYLFEAELVGEGRPVLLPREFLAQMARWTQSPLERRALREVSPPVREPAAEGDEEERTPIADLELPLPEAPAPQVAPSPPGADEPPPVSRPERTTLPLPALAPATPEAPRLDASAPRAGGLPRMVALGAPIFMALTATLALLVSTSTGTFSVELSSSPPGAAIRVNGQPQTARTPALLTQLPADVEHLLEVQLPGRVPWSQTVRAERGTTLAVHARLLPKRPHTAAPAPRPHQPPPPRELRMPAGRISLSSVVHAFRVPYVSTAQMRLDPSRTYSVRVEGQASLGGVSSVAHAGYFLEGDSRLAARESFGVLDGEDRMVRNASRLHVFLLDANRTDNHGTLRVRVREWGNGSADTILRVDARTHAVKLSRADRFLLRGLEPGTTYEFVLWDTEEPAQTRGFDGGPVSRVLGLYGAGEGPEAAPGLLTLLEVGRPLRIRGTSWLQLAFPDDHLTDNTGSLLLEVTPVAGPDGPPASPPPSSSTPAR
ncbi:protein kinase domain-containing protein [Corallococcus macrosporus]|uniref:Serine/threonine protein kinase n=1 Tax=Myxococcus fulvus (strain ATCC BAA-855 / HW-1) TaxID=483219 RepID=F8CLW1_MYXFH|nr:protein kinase [Corallococcus macrosporus]AEI68997.1 serine/threonine protein kinase [Corallococcus macrosporus]